MNIRFFSGKLGYSLLTLALMLSPLLTPQTAHATLEEAGYEHALTFGSEGTSDGQFNYPQGLTVAPNGDIYVADADNNRIQIFTANGTYKAQFGTPGNADGQFNYPHGLTVAPNGDLYVADTYNHRIQIFRNLNPPAAPDAPAMPTPAAPDAMPVATATSGAVDLKAPNTGVNTPAALILLTTATLLLAFGAVGRIVYKKWIHR